MDGEWLRTSSGFYSPTYHRSEGTPAPLPLWREVAPHGSPEWERELRERRERTVDQLTQQETR